MKIQMTEDKVQETEQRSEEGQEPLQASDELRAAQLEAAEWRDKFVRQLAEFDNFRKRTRAELEGLRDAAAESLIASLLPLYDDFERMRETAGNADQATLRKGFELMHQTFQSFLYERGVSRLECRGKEFDPNQHDAIMMQPREGFPAGVVLEEVTPGYKLGEKVIRHAQVVVSSEPLDDQASRPEGKAE